MYGRAPAKQGDRRKKNLDSPKGKEGENAALISRNGHRKKETDRVNPAFPEKNGACA